MEKYMKKKIKKKHMHSNHELSELPLRNWGLQVLSFDVLYQCTSPGHSRLIVMVAIQG
jgi:hypothetical protein